MNRSVAVLSCIALMAVGLGCSNSSEPPTEVISEAELSGRYEPGTADAKWIWFSGVAESPTFKGQKKDGSAFQGAYRFEKSDLGNIELVLTDESGVASRHPFVRGTTLSELASTGPKSRGDFRLQAAGIRPMSNSTTPGLAEEAELPTSVSCEPTTTTPDEPSTSTKTGSSEADGVLLVNGCSKLIDDLKSVIARFEVDDRQASSRVGAGPQGGFSWTGHCTGLCAAPGLKELWFGVTGVSSYTEVEAIAAAREELVAGFYARNCTSWITTQCWALKD